MRRCLNCMQEYQDNYNDACPNCGYRGEATQDGGVCLAPGTILQGRYIIGTVIRTRDIDIFYNCWDALFERRVQVQEYFPRYCATRSGGAEVSVYEAKKEQYLEGLRLFCGQSRELIRLYKEEDVVTYHALFQDNRTAYAVMDAPEAPSLKTWLGGRMPGEQEIMDLMRQAIRAVDKCHKLGIYHGTIGQDTFWMADKGNLVLKDFGSWRYISGKPGIVNYGSVDGEADVFGLAKTFCQIATGMDTEDEKTLIKRLSNGTPLTKQMANALKKALSHETKMLDDFCRDLEGKGHKKGIAPLPRWAYIAGAGAAMVAVVSLSAFAFVRYGGMEKIKSINLPWAKGQEAGEETAIPPIVDLSVEEGERLLHEAGFENVAVEEEPGYGPHNTIIRVSPEEGTVCSLDTSIIITVCVNELDEPPVGGWGDEGPGPEGAEEGEAEGKATVPGVTGINQDEAIRQLEKVGFGVKLVEADSEKQIGNVLEQEPKAGDELEKGMFVTLKVSNGEAMAVMENVVGKTSNEAKAIIQQLGLQVGSVSQSADNQAKGVVISQSLSPGTKVNKGTKVNLVVSKGKGQPAGSPIADDAQRKADEEARKQLEESDAKREAEEAAQRASREAYQKDLEDAARRESEELAREEAEKEARNPEGKENIRPTPAPPQKNEGETSPFGPGGYSEPEKTGPVDRN